LSFFAYNFSLESNLLLFELLNLVKVAVFVILEVLSPKFVIVLLVVSLIDTRLFSDSNLMVEWCECLWPIFLLHFLIPWPSIYTPSLRRQHQLLLKLRLVHFLGIVIHSI
jgi:hypothetical protein